MQVKLNSCCIITGVEMWIFGCLTLQVQPNGCCVTPAMEAWIWVLHNASEKPNQRAEMGVVSKDTIINESG